VRGHDLRRHHRGGAGGQRGHHPGLWHVQGAGPRRPGGAQPQDRRDAADPSHEGKGAAGGAGGGPGGPRERHPANNHACRGTGGGTKRRGAPGVAAAASSRHAQHRP
jgi:hypothetical protein